MWAIGCILHELVFKRKPFTSDWDMLKYVMAVEGGKSVNVIEVKSELVPDERKRLFISQKITELLSIDPNRRPGAELLYETFTSWGNHVERKEVGRKGPNSSCGEHEGIIHYDGIEITPITSLDVVSDVDGTDTSSYVEVIDIETFRRHEGLDLALFALEQNESAAGLQRFIVMIDTTFASLYEQVCERYGLSRANNIRLWRIGRRQNGTLRPDLPISPHPELST